MKNKMLMGLAAFCLVACASPKQDAGEQQALCFQRKQGENLIIHGNFENLATRKMTNPWLPRPQEAGEAFHIQEGEAYDGNHFLGYTAEPKEWYGISQKISLPQNKKFTVSFLIKGDSTEVHTGAFNAGNFLGWNNATVPDATWKPVYFDFYTDSSSAPTTIYIASKREDTAYHIQIDDIQLIEELPVK